MHEILRLLPSDARVLDLGCATGSFPEDQCAAKIVRYDLDCHPTEKGSAAFVCGDARTLPFQDRSFNAAILNHSLEHFSDPGIALSEIKRVLDEPAYLYVAVPDASTITDRLYRWLARGGGHVNQFTDADSLVRLIEEKTNLSHVGTRLLFTSFSFMNRYNCRTRPPRRLYLVGGGAEWVLRLATFILRKTDKLIGTRTSIYGWAFCFGAEVAFDTRPWSNTCVRCGSGHPSDSLVRRERRAMFGFGPRLFRCPACGTENYFTEDQAFLSMR
jgi:SAM-dependent methyltransferase